MRVTHWTGESLTVAELRRALEGMPDDAEVVIQTSGDVEDVRMLSSRDRGSQGVTFYLAPELTYDGS